VGNRGKGKGKTKGNGNGAIDSICHAEPEIETRVYGSTISVATDSICHAEPEIETRVYGITSDRLCWNFRSDDLREVFNRSVQRFSIAE
jgi:hypothetical protein